MEKINIEEIVKVLSCIVGIDKSAYVSVPITTGDLYINWYKQYGFNLDLEEYKTALKENVIKNNIINAGVYIKKIREHFSGVVIEPTAIEMPNWSQNDYHIFWGKVIELYATKVFFKNGWYLSKGCSYEFLIASKKGIPTIDEDFNVISIEKGLELIREGINDYAQIGTEITFFENICTELQYIN